MEATKNQEQASPNEEKQFYLLIAIIFFAIFGVTMILFSLSFIKDLETLQTVPDAVWDFICGKPSESPITLPLLLTISALSFIVSAGLAGWRWYIGR